MSEGDEYAYRLLHPPVDYARESFHEAQRSNAIQWKNYIVAIAALVVACVGLLVTLITIYIRPQTTQRQTPPTFAQPSIPLIFTQPPISPTYSQPTLAPTVNEPTLDLSPVLLDITERQDVEQGQLVIYKDIYFLDPDVDSTSVQYVLLGTKKHRSEFSRDKA